MERRISARPVIDGGGIAGVATTHGVLRVLPAAPSGAESRGDL
jgi:hypothetical protein